MIAGVLITIGALLMGIEPLRRERAWRRWQRTASAGVVLREGVPMAATDTELDNLVVHADVAIARDQLLQGVAGVAEIYKRA